jgi:hypothetical protein
MRTGAGHVSVDTIRNYRKENTLLINTNKNSGLELFSESANTANILTSDIPRAMR